MSRSLKARLYWQGAEPAGQTLCQLESREDVNPLVSGYSCLREIQTVIKDYLLGFKSNLI